MTSDKTYENMKKAVDNLDKLCLDNKSLLNTKLCIIDINNGFAREGALYSDRVEKNILGTAKLAKKFLSSGGTALAYTDYHPEDAKEFKAYPPHCIAGTKESQLVDELEELKEQGLQEIRKNSTNGMLAFNPFEKGKDYLIVGCVTDICVYQFSTTLRAYLNENNLDGEVYVLKDLIDTFDIKDVHEAGFYNYVFTKSMMDNGIKVVSGIEFKE